MALLASPDVGIHRRALLKAERSCLLHLSERGRPWFRRTELKGVYHSDSSEYLKDSSAAIARGSIEVNRETGDAASAVTPTEVAGRNHVNPGRDMTDAKAISQHWAVEDVFGLVVSTLKKMSKPLDGLTIEDLAPVDHFHARGLPATVELADRLPIKPGQHILDIGCGLGGPARCIAQRFQCNVSGIDVTLPFVEAANKLTRLLKMEAQVKIEHGNAECLPYADCSFDAAYAQHVTMNVADRPSFFAEAHRVLKPGAFFALTEHGLGAKGNPYHPVPWSTDGSGAHLLSPADTEVLLEKVGFTDFAVEDTGAKYLAAYRTMIEKAEKGDLPPLGLHLLMGKTALEKVRNSARNIEEGRTHPVQVICRKRE